MNRLQKALGWRQAPPPAAPEPAAAPEPVARAADEAAPVLPAAETDAHEAALAKARRDVRRFGLAIEQCLKGEERLTVLRHDLIRAERRLAALEIL